MIQMINGVFFFSGDSRSGDNNSLTVSIELNGITYQGVLFAQSPTNNNSSRTALAS